MSDDLHHYIVVRRDLPFGVICAMVAHAAGESFYQLAFRGGLTSGRPGEGPFSRAGAGEHPARGATSVKREMLDELH